MRELHIQDIDTDKYLENYFNPTGETTREIDLEEEEKHHREYIESINNNTRLSDDEKRSSLEYAETNHKGMIDSINKTNYWQPPTEREKEVMQNIINSEIAWRTRHYEFELERRPLPKAEIISEYLERILKDDLPNFSKVQREVLEGRVIQDFNDVARYIGFIKFAQKLDNELSDENNQDAREQRPIKWMGKTAHLGYYMNLFAELGYIDAPVKKDGEMNYNEFARQLAKAFDFDGNNIGTLAKALSPESNNMGNDNKDKIQIPHLKDLA